MFKPLLALICCLSAFGYAAPASSSAFYEVLGRWSEPHVSADGDVVVASVAVPDFVGTVYRWTLHASEVTTETLPIEFAQVNGTNRDGSVLVGTTVGGAFRWTAASGVQILAAPPSQAWDVSSDGDVVVGDFNNEAFRWDEGVIGFNLLGFLRGDAFSHAAAVAGNGGAVVGLSAPPRPIFEEGRPALRAFRWTWARGMHGLGNLPDRLGNGQALGISSGGDVVVGQFDFEAFRWIAGDGMVGLGFLLDGATSSMATDVSGDGNRIVGWSTTTGNALDQTAFLWTPEDGMRSLKQVLAADPELDLEGVQLVRATSISDDGRVIAGIGRRDRRPMTWIAELNPARPPDAFQCYDVKATRGSARFEAREVSLSDRFGDSVQIVKKGKRLCAPVELDRAEVYDPDAQLLCYDLVQRRGQGNPARPEPVEVWASNELGDDQRLTATRAKRLCVPSTVDSVEPRAAAGDPSEPELDHYLCYPVRANRRDFDAIQVSLADDHQASERVLKKPTELCNPVDKNGEGILDPDARLICYNARPVRGEPAGRGLNLDVLVNNQFGDAQPFTLKKPRTVCVPSPIGFGEGPAACSEIEPGEFGLCRAIIGWGIDPVSGQCEGISGCACDERCDGRIFPDELTCQQECADP